MKNTEALAAASHDASLLGIDTTTLPSRPDSPQPRSPRSLLSSATTLVHDNPWYAATLALGAGVILGLLGRRLR